MRSQTSETVNLVLGACSQHPVGCSEEDLEGYYQRYYKPLAQIAYRYPQCAWMLHLGGELLEWIDRNHPELIMLLREMIKRRQVEVLGGGFYAPVLPIIPALDRVGQIEKLTTELRVRFGTRPRGVWLVDCVWEPSLPHTLAGSGMEYAFLDRAQFVSAGVSVERLCSAHLTEDEGRMIAVIPIRFRLSELMATATPEEAVDSVACGCSGAGDRVVVAVDEPERMGDHRWLECFLRLVSADARIVSATPRAYLRRHGTRGFVYLDCGMRANRQEFPDSGVPALADIGDRMGTATEGLFRRNLSCSADSRFLYAKMVHANLLVNQVRGDRERRRAARDDLWRGQCGHAYWNRPGGGISARRTRDAAYESLLRAEVRARDETSFLPSVICTDYDMDGATELLYHGRLYNAYVHTAGGMLFELDYLPGSFNFMNTLSRTGDPGSESPDPYLRRGFLDHFLASAPTVNDHVNGFTRASSSAAEQYVVQSFENDRLTLICRGVSIPTTGAATAISADLYKSYRFRARSLEVRYDIVASSDIDVWLGVETNLSVGADSIWQATGPRSSRRLTRRATSLGPTTLVEVDNPSTKARLTIRAGDAQSGVYAPVHINGEFQYCGLVIAWRLRAAAGERWTRRVSIAFSRR